MKFFKPLAIAAAAACVAAPAMADSKAVEIYGVAAFGLMSTEGSNGDRTNEVLNESRIGFRGSKALPKFGDTKFIWQIESGFMGPNGLSGATYESGTLGTRDTFGGVQGNFGTVRIGRLLTPFGETLDWPYTNGGVGPIMEATNVPGGGSYVRESDQLRWDSVTTGPLTASISAGRGTRSPSTGNGFVNKDSTSVSAVAHYAVGGGALHLGYERNSNRDTTGSLNTNWLLGMQTPSFGGVSAYGAYTKGTASTNATIGNYPAGEYSRGAYQLAVQYDAGDFVAKITHAKNLDLSGPVIDNGGNMTAAQILFNIDPSLITYARYVTATDPNTTAGWWNKSRVLLGMEYYF